jgi:hypothetical protein
MVRTLLLALVIVGATSTARAQSNLVPEDPRPVFGDKGVQLGVVERVVFGSDGKPAQILVRPKSKASSGPRSLAYAGLDKTPQGYVTPLTKAEFDAMPAVELEDVDQ